MLRNPYSEVRGVNSSCFSTRAASRRIGFFDRDGFKRILGNMLPSALGSDSPPPLYGVHPGFTLKYVIRFSSVLVFVLPMKIENRLVIGRDFFADWLSSLSTFSRTEKSSLAASQPPRVSSTIKPRCDAAPVPHTPHTSTSIPAHARSSDLRQHQVSLVSINTRARFGARVAARPRDSGDRSGRCFPPQKGPVYRGVPLRVRRV